MISFSDALTLSIKEGRVGAREGETGEIGPEGNHLMVGVANPAAGMDNQRTTVHLCIKDSRV